MLCGLNLNKYSPIYSFEEGNLWALGMEWTWSSERSLFYSIIVPLAYELLLKRSETLLGSGADTSVGGDKSYIRTFRVREK